MQNQATDLQKTVELVRNMTEEEKAEIVKVIPTRFLYEEIGKRFMVMEKRLEDAARMLSGG